MGLFSKPSIEKELEKTYIPMFQSMGMSLGEAKQQFFEYLDKCKLESEREGTDKLPQNFSEVIIENKSSEAGAQDLLARLRIEGVTDNDIRWWWNMHDLERRMMRCDDEWTRMTMFMHYTNNDKMSIEEAKIKLNKRSVLYGSPDLKKQNIEKDDPLPFELKDRINIYINNRAQNDIQDFFDEIDEFSSINAFFRIKIKAGEV